MTHILCAGMWCLMEFMGIVVEQQLLRGLKEDVKVNLGKNRLA